MNHPSRILLAACTLPGNFSAEALVVAAWKMFPEAFGLREYRREYPSSNAVLSYVHGRTRGLVYEGYLRKTGLGMYAVTQAGRERAAAIEGESRRTA